MQGNLIIISSPSGGGKGTLILELLHSEIVSNIGYCVSYTTRAIRDGETHGHDYFFVSREEFLARIENGEFLEYAEVHGNLYGTPIQSVKDAINRGKDIILEIDVQGAASVRAKIPEALSVFILPPSFEVLKNRLTTRATENPEDLALRLKNSFGEVGHFSEFEYVVINDDAARAAADLQTVILADRLRRVRQEAAIKGILSSFETSKNHAIGE